MPAPQYQRSLACRCAFAGTRNLNLGAPAKTSIRRVLIVFTRISTWVIRAQTRRQRRLLSKLWPPAGTIYRRTDSRSRKILTGRPRGPKLPAHSPLAVPPKSKNRARIGIIDPSVPPVKLLRGINVGGKNKLPMKDLAAMFQEAGCDDVRTLHPEWERSISSRSGTGRRHPVPDQCVNLEPLRLSRSSGRPHGP